MKNTSQVSSKHGAALEGWACPLLRAAGGRGLPTAPFPADTRSGSPHAGALRDELAQRARIGKGLPPAVDPGEPLGSLPLLWCVRKMPLCRVFPGRYPSSRSAGPCEAGGHQQLRQ